MLPALYGQLAQQAAFNDPLVQATAAALAANTVTSSAQNQQHDSSSSTTPTGSRDTTYTKIFVGGLPYHTTDKTLHDYFKQFGDIEEAVVITDRATQKSRGYGFVTMKDRAEAEKACKDPNPIIDGRKANVNLAYLGAKPRNNVQLAAMSTGLAQLQMPTTAAQQLAALLPGRLGVPQLYYPTVSSAAGAGALLNPLAASQMNPQSQLLAAFAQIQQLQQAQAAQAVQQQQTTQAQQAAMASQPYFNYAALQQALAAAGQPATVTSGHAQAHAVAQAAQAQQNADLAAQLAAAQAAANQTNAQVAAAGTLSSYAVKKETKRFSPY